MSMLTFSDMKTSGKVPEFWDGITCRFDFICEPKLKVGQYTEIYNIMVKCPGLLRAMHLKNLSDEEINKCLYWRARKAINDDPLKQQQEVTLHHSEISSFDPYYIKFPNPDSFDVEIP